MKGFLKLKGEIACSISCDDLAEQFYLYFSSLNLETFVSLFTNRYEETLNYLYLLQNKPTCQKMSLLFNPHRLDTKGKKSKQSVFAALQNKKYCASLARDVLFRCNIGEAADRVLFRSIQFSFGGVQFIGEFMPYAMRNICIDYCLDSTSKVLDPCAGWGGRMIGASTVVNEYVCYEPYTLTYRGLKKLYVFLSSMNNKFNATIVNKPFEDVKIRRNYYDLAVTSPPYYDTEIYTDEHTNCINRYVNFDSWVEKFYYPLIEKTMSALKPHGAFILNVGNRKYPLDELLFSEFGGMYNIKQIKAYAGSTGIRIKGKGELFFEIKKS